MSDFYKDGSQFTMDIEELLTQTRNKSDHRFAIRYRLAYAIVKLFRKMLGQRRTLVILLNSTWMMSRLAFEEAVRDLGVKFTDNALGIHESVIQQVSDGCKTALDVGCGSGRLSQTLAAYVDDVVGVDHNPKSIRLARARGIPNAKFIIGDITDSEILGRQKFDLVLLIHVLEHVNDPVGLLSSLKDLTTTLLVEVPDVTSNPLDVARALAGTPFYSDADHVREYTNELLSEQLNESGWPNHQIWKTRGQLLARASRFASVSVL